MSLGAKKQPQGALSRVAQRHSQKLFPRVLWRKKPLSELNLPTEGLALCGSEPLDQPHLLLLRLLSGWGNVLLLAGYTIECPSPKEHCRLHWLGRPISEV